MSDEVTLESFFDRLAGTNPFLENRVNAPAPAGLDVPDIHRAAFAKLEHRGKPPFHDGPVEIGWQFESATIEIRDSGPGIPDKVRSRLFEAFQSAARRGGTGLGLAIAAELVRAHGGELKLSATGAEGSVFLFTIPDRVGELRSGRRGERRAAEG